MKRKDSSIVYREENSNLEKADRMNNGFIGGRERQ
jgi:hypothetical protein